MNVSALRNHADEPAQPVQSGSPEASSGMKLLVVRSPASVNVRRPG
jgi:hypothetical protein